MPSQRKRIGFLPRTEVQDIINQICKHNKLSQSKVTGILVEEALGSRQLLDTPIKNSLNNLDLNYNKSLLITNDSFNNEANYENDKLNLDENYIKNEIKMINDFIEFKFFKNIINKKKKKNQE